MIINYEFYVYQVYVTHPRDNSECFLRSFRVIAPGHSLAKKWAGESQDSFGPLIESGHARYYWRCSKRSTLFSVDEEMGKVEYKGEMKLNKAQMNYFKNHRQMTV